MPSKKQAVNEENLENCRCFALESKDADTISSLAWVYDYLFGNDDRFKIDDFRVNTEKNGAAIYWPLEDLYANQYKGAEKTPEEKLRFKKAILVNALTGSGKIINCFQYEIHLQ